MGDAATFAATTFWAFIQVFARVSALFASAPIFGDRSLPTQTKIGLAVIISMVMVPVVKQSLLPVVPANLDLAVMQIAGQVVIGLLLGYMVSLFFEIVRLGGALLDYQMGFTQAAQFDPQFNETVTPIANFQYRYAMAIYLFGNGHWMMLAALQRSFIALPVSKLVFGPNVMNVFADVTFHFIVYGIQIAAPAAAVLLITDVSFAFLNRAVPQMQVYFVGMPVKVLGGMVLLIIMMPTFTAVVSALIAPTTNNAFQVIQGLHAGR